MITASINIQIDRIILNIQVLGCFNYIKKSFWNFWKNFGIFWNLSFLLFRVGYNYVTCIGL